MHTFGVLYSARHDRADPILDSGIVVRPFNALLCLLFKQSVVYPLLEQIQMLLAPFVAILGHPVL